MSERWDAIVVGGGHNGLTCAAYLAKAGRKVLVLERRHVLGGAAVSEEIYPGFTYSVCSYVVSLLRPWIIRELELPRFGLDLIPLESSFLPLPDENGEQRIARWACYLVAFLPYSITIAINHRKEPIVVLLATFVFLHASRTIRFERGWPFSIVCVFTALFAFFFFRSGFVLPFVAILFLCYIATTQSLVRSVALAVPMLVIMVGIEFLVSDDVTISFQRQAERLQGKIAGSANLAEVGGLVRFARMTSLLELWKLPLATFLVVILPYPPYFSGNLPSIILSWANLLNLAFLPHMFRGAWAVVRETEWQRRLPLLIFPFIFLILIGATHVGTVRYRETVFPVMLVLAAIGLHRRSNLLLNAAVYGGLIFIGGVAYFARFA